jgi:DNA adenine methylase
MTLPLPFLKWAGGKRWIDAALLPDPARVRTYREPFLGSGAVARHYLGRVPCVLSDANARLIRCYRGVRGDVEGVVRRLECTAYTREEYARTRRDFNSRASVTDTEIAAWFVYLNRCGFNGLYRENADGEFNVPFGRYANPTICDATTLRAWSALLRGVALRDEDFEEALDDAEEGDFVYLDPPYVPVSETADFTAYVAGGFGPADQDRLDRQLVHLDARGAHWILSNAAAARGRYARWHVREIEVPRKINRDPAKRGPVTELLVSNRPLRMKEV